MKKLIQELIDERYIQNKECIYLVIGKEQFNRLWLEVKDSSIMIYNPLERKFHDFIYNGLKVIIVNSNIIEVVGNGEI